MTCGRVLGLRFDGQGFLYALDAYSGIKRINVTSGQVVTLFDFSTGMKFAGRKIIFLDDFVMQESDKGRGHVFYITDSSAKYEVELCHLSTMEGEATGRLLKFDADTNELTVIKDNMAFPNGIELSDDKTFLLVNELGRRKLWKIYLKDGKSEELMRNLPGFPDNIRRSTRTDIESYWIGMFGAKTEVYLYEDLKNNSPFLFTMLIRSLYNFDALLKFLSDIIPRPYCKHFDIPGSVGMKMLQLTNSVPGLAIEVDTKGNILRSVQDPEGRITFLAEAREVIEGDYRVLYLGSYVNDYLGRVVLERVEHQATSSSSKSTSTTTSSTASTTKTQQSSDAQHVKPKAGVKSLPSSTSSQNSRTKTEL